MSQRNDREAGAANASATEQPTQKLPAGGFSPLARFLIVAACIAIVALFMRLASSILAPMLLALFITIIATPALRWLRRIGLPKWGALGAIAFILIDIGSIVALIGSGALEGFRDRLPTFQERLALLSGDLGLWLESIGLAGTAEAVPDMLDTSRLSTVVRGILASLGGSLGTGLLILILVIFMLAEAGSLRDKIRAGFNLSDANEARLRALLKSVNQYIIIKTVMSLAIAICVWILLKLMSIDFAILWAIIAFVLNFIPVIGNLVMMVPAALMALVQHDVQTAIIVVVGYVLINGIIGNVIEPRVTGKGLGISTVAVFLSLMFWGWVFGTVGMFLSVPLTMAVIAVLDAHPSSRPLAILLGPPVAWEDLEDGPPPKST